MPIFCGCVSSKQSKSPDKKVKKKKKQKTAEQDKEGKADTIQNGGERADGATENPDAPATHDVSLSQVDVTEHVTAPSAESSSERCQSFPTRPSTIVKEDGLILEIEAALSTPSSPTSVNEQKTKTEAKETNQETPNCPPPPPPNAITTLPPQPTDTTTSTPTTITTTSTATPVPAEETKIPQDPEEEVTPPTLPPRPKPSSQTSPAESADKSQELSDEPPPSLPPRTVPIEKPPPASMEAQQQTAEEGAEGEECPPVLPPRCVPPSPPKALTVTTASGVSVFGSDPAPPKPRRCSTDSNFDEGLMTRKAKPASFREPPPLPEDWAIIDLPKTDAELLRLTRQPEQLATIASQYVVKHISLHTDVRVTADLSEQIYTAFLEVARQHRSILHRFLTDLIEDQANSGGGDSQPAEPSHGAIIVLVREILRQYVNTESVVTVSIQILRAVSRVGGATQALEECGVTGAVLGVMSAHKTSPTVQRYCLKVLEKIASFSPSPQHKAPLDQLGADLICQSLESFPKSVEVVQAACHVLTTLVTTLHKVFSAGLDKGGGTSEEQDKFMAGLLTFLEYVFTKCLPAVRSALKCHDQDPTVTSYGRQFLVSYSQLEQLRQRKKQQVNGNSPTLSPALSPPPLPARRQGTEGKEQTSEVSRLWEQVSNSASEDLTKCPPLSTRSYPPCVQSMEYENWDLLRGVLKKKSSLRGHSYSKADLQFMQQLTKTQVVALVCALAVDGHVQDALKLLDRPVAEMVQTSEVAPGVRDFIAHHCTAAHTLIDLDPGLFVSLIDAVRYPSLSYQMAQNCVLEVASSLNDQQQMPVVAVTVEFLASTITNPSLAPAMTVPGFVDKVCEELERAKAVSTNSAALVSLLSEIRQCARKSTHN